MSSWKTYRLGDFAEINPRRSLKKGEEYSFVEMKDLEAKNKFATSSSKRTLKGGSKFQDGDTLFARITPCLENGKICQVKNLENGVGFGSTEFLVFRGIEGISDSDFLYYLTKSDFVRHNAIQMMTGTSGRQRVERTALEDLEVNVPDLSTQKEIAQILSSLYDKIELNLQMNQTLEDTTKTVFEEWFIKFNFPGFNGEFENDLPKGWEMKKIGELGSVITGSTPSSKKPQLFGKETPFITPSDFKNYGKLILDAKRYLSVQGKEAMKSKLLPPNSVLVTCIGSDMGKLAINRVESVSNQQINSIVPDTNLVSADYLYYDLIFKYGYLRNIATGGSTMPIINKSRFQEIEITVPTEDVRLSFKELMENFNSKIEENVKQIKSLSQTRDSLIPMLMSGQLETA